MSKSTPLFSIIIPYRSEIEHSDSLKDKDGLIFLSGIQGIVYMKETVLQLGLNRHAILENLIW
jgi:hypothetical protein